MPGQRLTVENGRVEPADIQSPDHCPRCDAVLAPDWTYCPHCGRELDS